MKRLVPLLALFLVLLSPALADIMPSGAHAVERCVQIHYDPAEDVLLGVSTLPGSDGVLPQAREEGIAMIEPETCLSKGYKYNRYAIYAVTPAYYARVSTNLSVRLAGQQYDPDHPLYVLDDPNLVLVADDIDPWGGYVALTDMLYKETYRYRYIDGKLLLTNERFSYYTGGGTGAFYDPGQERPLPSHSSDEGRGFPRFLLALLVTVIVETLVLVALRKPMKLDASWTRLLLAGVLPSLVTLPIIWYVLIGFPVIGYAWGAYMLVSEVFAVVAEGFLLKPILKTTWLTCFLVSLVANAASFLVGLLIL